MTATHVPYYGRTRTGQRPQSRGGSGMHYATTVRCSCGEFRKQINQAPSKGGQAMAKSAFAQHLKDVDASPPAEGRNPTSPRRTNSNPGPDPTTHDPFTAFSDAPREPIDPARLAVARRYAGFHIGNPSWANEIVRAYTDPAAVSEELDRDGADDEGGVRPRGAAERAP